MDCSLHAGAAAAARAACVSLRSSVFVKQYGIYATGPNRSEAPGSFASSAAMFGSTSTRRMARCATDAKGCSDAIGRSLARCTSLNFWFCQPPIVARVLVVALCAMRLRFHSYRCRHRVAKNEPIAKCSWSLAKCSWLMKENLLCREHRRCVSFSWGLHGRLHMRGGSKMRESASEPCSAA